MGIQVAAVVTPPPCSSPSSSPASPSSSAIATSPRHAVLGARLARSQSSLACWNAGLGRRRGGQHAIRRALSASIDSVGSGGGEDEEFLRRIQELAAGQHPGAGGCGWPASVERSASSVGLPLSLRMLKRRKQQQQLEQGRWNERLIDCAGESARAAVGRAFSSMVLIIRELQSFTLQMREAVVYEDLQGVLARVHAEMHASFVWLFQHIFSGTPALMVSLMLLLANFTVYSMGDSVAAAASLVPPPQAAVEMVDIQQQPEQQQSHSQQRFDTPALKTFSTGRTASVGGNGDGGGKVRPVAGATGDGQSDESSHRQNGAVVLPQDVSQSQATPLASVSDSMAVEDAQAQQTVHDDELAIWKRISDEAARMQASVRAEELMDPETLEQLVAPVEAPKPDTVHYSPEHVATAQRYEQALSEEPNSSLLLANFAQFLYQVQGDLDRAEHFFKRAVRAEPADAEALGRYAAFLWQARDDLAAAEETYQEAIAADPGNAHHAAAYAHFLWNTGGEDTCYPLD
ncbi:uncharacterized protein LOC100275415 [Zea mays]|uniref:Tetratricopeptide repeat (TPR)-like superfamily protein n=1 Tax=Zea mays TaxID=4577 RepID=K7V795_MAIZE|nr:uncharacterized protein LOC100275415 [Zea mays]AQK99342.1 Tetratricopeptide repeat (TPR)-like superfamily protein [Zea mays]